MVLRHSEMETSHLKARGLQEPGVLAAAASGVVPFIERQRGDIDRIFGYAGIAPDMAGSPTLQLSLHSFCRLFEQGARVTGNNNFGLWFGNQFEPRDLGLWGYAAVSAPTLGAALDTLVELFPYHQQSSSMHLKREPGGLVKLDYRIEAPGIVERRQDAELSLGMFLNVIRECMGPHWAADEVHFEHPKPEAWREHERAFSAPVFFSQSTNALVFRDSILDMPMPKADIRLMQAMRMCLERLSGSERGCARVIDRVREAVRSHLPDGAPTMESVAASLRLPSSVIGRELRFEGLTFQDLVETVRHELAISYLKQRQLPLSEIAFLLGYSELSAFSRAVRRWTGQSPRAVRHSLLHSV
ncbi:MAG: AraC family transcriptional regulator [Hyphomicrobium sp.]|nr:AraC family transcriptional regulator [Hyphomicrobium sp.]